MNKSILSLLTCFSLLIVSYGAHADDVDVCYTVDGEVHTVNNPDRTQSGRIELNLHSPVSIFTFSGGETYYLEGNISGTIPVLSPTGTGVKLAHNMDGTENYEWEINTQNDTVFFTELPDLDSCFLPVLEVMNGLSSIPSFIGSVAVTSINLVIEGELNLCGSGTQNSFEEITGVICTISPIE